MYLKLLDDFNWIKVLLSGTCINRLLFKKKIKNHFCLKYKTDWFRTVYLSVVCLFFMFIDVNKNVFVHLQIERMNPLNLHNKGLFIFECYMFIFMLTKNVFVYFSFNNNIIHDLKYRVAQLWSINLFLWLELIFFTLSFVKIKVFNYQ